MTDEQAVQARAKELLDEFIKDADASGRAVAASSLTRYMAQTEARAEQAEAALREVFTLAAASLAATTPGEPCQHLRIGDDDRCADCGLQFDAIATIDLSATTPGEPHA